MKNQTLTSILIGSFLVFAAPLTLADAPTSQPGQMMKALEALQAKGYVIVKKIEFDNSNGAYKAKVVNAQGKNMDIQFNPTTNEMTKPASEVEGLTAIEIAKKVELAGYKNIYEINTEMFGDEYVVKVMDDKGQKGSLKLDIKTGNITKAPE